MYRQGNVKCVVTGFKAYTGFMQIEYAHTHPVVMVFVQLMLLGNQEVKRRNMCQCKLLIKELKENGMIGHVETRIEGLVLCTEFLE